MRLLVKMNKIYECSDNRTLLIDAWSEEEVQVTVNNRYIDIELSNVNVVLAGFVFDISLEFCCVALYTYAVVPIFCISLKFLKYPLLVAD